ncbi:hypothetical protein FKW77_007738 [Venturia effusa]|uniref:HPt domain-containing protein n=1 Tax=Venturia effusa TaxID=50376 RepID=A0A517LE58_9PEZI|nr:hypothetical protein FKW77_007738 [Venturia effusa]
MPPAADDGGDSSMALLAEASDEIDRTTFEQILEMDDDEQEREFSRSIVFDFFDQAESTFVKMDSYLKDKDLDQLSALGHFLKGSSATLGLTKVKDSCEKIQHFGARKDETGQLDEDDDEKSLKRLAETIATAKTEFHSVEEVLKRSGYKAGQSSGSSKQPNQPKRAPLTHFLCLPLVTEKSKPQLEASLSRFRKTLSAKFLDGLPADDATPRAFGQGPRVPLVPPSAIRPVGTIHFTLGVMSLETNERVQEAADFLRGLDLKSMIETNSRANDPLIISLTSLRSMHAPQSTSVLYAGPGEDSDDLIQIASVLRSTFTEQGYLIPDERPLKLHATIVNTIYAKSGNKKIANLKINAEGLLDEWKDFVWAKDFTIEKLAICKMGAKKITDADGEIIGEEYEEMASIQFST